MKKIVLTGGGTAGHVTPNIALLPSLIENGFEIHYIGSYEGIEKSLIGDYGIPYHGISSGKLRRYFDIKNFTDPFRVLKGFSEANKLMKELKPSIVFSKGGFVSVPVVIAAKRNKIPSILHESDMTPGLANKLCLSSATKICCNFPETMPYLPAGKALLSGSPIRKELLEGNKIKALDFCGFTANRPVVLVMGGSLGAAAVNQSVRAILPALLKDFQVVHLCGKGKTNPEFDHLDGYRQFDYIKEELKDLLALADLVISRAGANAICELVALKKPNLLIPLPSGNSRGDQLLNARSFEKQGISLVLQEENLTDASLLDTIQTLYKKRADFIANMENSPQKDAISTIVQLIKETAIG